LQGNVATQLRCGEIFSNHVIAIFLQNREIENFFEKLIDMPDKIWMLTSLTHSAWFTSPLSIRGQYRTAISRHVELLRSLNFYCSFLHCYYC